jgi:large subunit ribosomal protein L19e
MAAEILKCGTNRVRITQSKDVEEALTRGDIRRLIVKGFIYKTPVKGKVRSGAKKVLKQKGRGRRTGRGSRKGKRGARQVKKGEWIKRVRALRRVLHELKDGGKISVGDYRMLYIMVKGNSFRNNRHLLSYLKEHELLKTKGAKAKPKPAGKKVPVKKAESRPKRAGNKPSSAVGKKPGAKKGGKE